MVHPLPIHQLKAALEARRLLAVEDLAGKSAKLPMDDLQKLAVMQSALTAVIEEIKAHEVKIGGGSETPLA